MKSIIKRVLGFFLRKRSTETYPPLPQSNDFYNAQFNVWKRLCALYRGTLDQGRSRSYAWELSTLIVSNFSLEAVEHVINDPVLISLNGKSIAECLDEGDYGTPLLAMRAIAEGVYI